MEKVDGVKQKTQRIEYIDAMRGFTMIIVVLHHVSLMAFGVNSAFEKWSYEFRMPLFFFISGFLMYKPLDVWDLKNTFTFLKKKVTNLIISPLIFFFIYVYAYKKDMIESLASPAKAGYWFTFVLFTFFLIYIVCQAVFDKLKLSSKKKDLMLLCVGILVFMGAYGISYLYLERNNFWAGFIGAGNLKYFIFLALGALVQKHFDKFERLLDASPLVMISIVAYFLMNVFYNPINQMGGAVRLLFVLLSGVTGVIIAFALFRKYQNYVDSSHVGGRVLQLVGRRTLDIYFLHYFFIPYQLGKAFPIFSEYNLPLVEIACSLFIALLIIAACLGVSAVLRTSATLGHILFGAKKDKRCV